DGNIRLKDLRNDTPYNTYTRKGLPPTPVAMPGKEALQAVLHPTATKALYFVSRGDGSHEFSSSLEEHNRAVLKYQLKGKSRNVFPSRAPDAVGHTSKIKLSP
ncbi:MAG: endolytic transglycosylase MltG, partial [Gammaproteobacteria bacterium]|nr:endolytic transglycosylase MltG [Gammaproteobacteria bacterium]